MILDKFPKARMHLLLLPKPDAFDGCTPKDVSELVQSQLPMLRHLHAVAAAVGRRVTAELDGGGGAGAQQASHRLGGPGQRRLALQVARASILPLTSPP